MADGCQMRARERPGRGGMAGRLDRPEGKTGEKKKNKKGNEGALSRGWAKVLPVAVWYLPNWAGVR